jgi:DNA-binding NarL/FixJ family response regulator
LDVLVVDDHPIIHETLGAVARAALPGAEIHGETSLSGALAHAARLKESLALVLLDLGLPGCSGIEALNRFREALPGLRVVVISATEDSGTVQAAIHAGAAGYIPKTTAPLQMVAALKLVVSGGTYLPLQVMREGERTGRAKKPAAISELGLTERQADVLRLLLKGLAYREIASQLKIAENTVKQHSHAVYRTLGVASRAEALIALARKGIKLE